MARRFTDASALVADLLDRYEARSSTRSEAGRLLAYVDYSGFRSIGEQDDCIAELHALRRAGGVAFESKRIDGVERIPHVRLADAAVLYRHLGRRPASEAATNALAALRRRAGLPEGITPLFDEIEQAWSRNVSWSILRPGRSKALSEATDLAVAIAGRADDAALPVDYRTFSRLAVGRSKSLERLLAVVAILLARLFPAVVSDPDLDAGDLLSSLGIMRLPQPFLVSGSFAVDGHPFPPLPYFGVPPEIAPRLRPARPVDYMLTVENYTSFVRHAGEVNGNANGIVVYTGGFPARLWLAAIVELATRAGAPLFHWGDLDPGGLRIFVHLERALRERGLILRPHLMSAEILASHGRPGSGSRPGLRLGKAADSIIAPLWDAMAADNASREVEQEALQPALPSF